MKFQIMKKNCIHSTGDKYDIPFCNIIEDICDKKLCPILAEKRNKISKKFSKKTRIVKLKDIRI